MTGVGEGVAGGRKKWRYELGKNGETDNEKIGRGVSF